jgi:hypothetical protein
VPLPETVTVPAVVPPLVQVVGAVACGPNTVKVIVPVAPLVAPDRVELIELAAMTLPVVALAGPAAVVLVMFLTVAVLVNPVVAVQELP